jgi:predicted O-methyltransferase YrrM
LTRQNAKRVLAIGTAVSEMPIEKVLAVDGTLILIEPDEARAEAARRHLSAIGLETRAAVIRGDPRRTVYKLAGPFDLIFCEPAYISVRGSIEKLLAPDGDLITDA